MKTTRIRSGLIAVLATLLAIGVPGTALASSGSLVDAAVESLQGGSSYVDPHAGTTQLDSGFDGSNVGVVVAAFESSGGNAGGLNAAQTADSIYRHVSGQYDAVIVVNSSQGTPQPYTVRPVAASEAILPILSGGTGVGNLNDFKTDVMDAAAALTTTSTGTAPPPPPSNDFPLAPLAIGGAFLGVALVATILFTVFRASRRGSKKYKTIPNHVIKNDSMKDEMEKFAKLTRRHMESRYPTARPMNSILLHLNELFTRLERKGVENQKSLAELEYSNTLKQLNNALGSDYYLDIAQNSRLWDRSGERLAEVEAAAKAVDNQLLLNIRQVNSSKDLDFRVALEGMLRSVDAPSAQDMVNPRIERDS